MKIVSAIEAHTLAHLPCAEIQYARRSDWTQAVESVVRGCATVAMEYSPMAAIPVVSNVDAGTVEWIRSLGPAVVSSADMAQELQAVWSDEQRQEN
ncbi:MAG: peptidase, partial [Candidatus Kapaibacterium sp.]